MESARASADGRFPTSSHSEPRSRQNKLLSSYALEPQPVELVLSVATAVDETGRVASPAMKDSEATEAKHGWRRRVWNGKFTVLRTNLHSRQQAHALSLFGYLETGVRL